MFWVLTKRRISTYDIYLMPFSKQKDFYEDFYGRSSRIKIRLGNKGRRPLYSWECDTYVQSWLKLTKKTRLWGSLLWFARFISPDILYFNPCVNTSTLCTRFCINRTDNPRKNTLSTSFLDFFLCSFLSLFLLPLYLFLFFLARMAHTNTRTRTLTQDSWTDVELDVDDSYKTI